jgi:sarcosine oxidase, subunit beta
MYDFKAIVVGGGVIGAAIFHELSKIYNENVLLIEQAKLANGSTGRSGGIVRCFHLESYLSDLAFEGFEYFSQFEKHTGISCPFNQTGFIWFTTYDNERTAKLEVQRLNHKIEISWLSKTEASSQFPFANWDDLSGVVFEPKAGYMSPIDVTDAWIQAGQKIGGQIFENVKVNELVYSDQTLRGIKTTAGFFRSSLIILCTGAWTEKLLNQWQLKVPITIKAKTIQMNRYSSLTNVSHHPSFIDSVHGLYGRADGETDILMGTPVEQWSIDPDQQVEINLSNSQYTSKLGSCRFQWTNTAKVVNEIRSFDAYTMDQKGLISSLPEVSGLYIASGFSGGGFKIAPAVASRIIELTKTIN